MSDNKHDSASQSLQNFSKAMASTASAIVSSNYNGDLLLTNTNYQKAMFDALNKKNHSTLAKTQYRSKKSPSEVIKSSFDTDARIFRALTKISDDLLNDIPQQISPFSLFQGFSASLPDLNEAIQMEKSLADQKALPSTILNDSPLPNGITVEKIKTTQSVRHLTNFKNEINYKLDLLEVRKGLSASEIQEIDSKIAKLQSMREIVFERVRKFEQDEIFLENQLVEINSRLDFIKDVGPISEDDNDGEDENDDSFEVIETDESFNNDDNDLLLSKSIYGKLSEDPPNRTKKTSNLLNKRKVSKSRKTKPTLQQYYEPGSEIKTFNAHNDSITCFDFDLPFGTLVSASLDNTVRVWDLSRNKCVGLLEGHVASVKCLQMEDTMVVTGSLDASLKLWNLSKLEVFDDSAEGPLQHTFESHIDEITALNFHNSTLVSGSNDRTIRQWDINTGHCIQTLDVLWASAQNSAYSSSSSSMTNKWGSAPVSFIGALQVYDAALASGTADGTVRLWDLRSGEVIRSLIGHTGSVTSLQFDDKYLVTGSSDRSIRIWDLRTGGIFDSFAYDSPISSLQFDSRRIVSSNNENTIKIYDRIEEKHSSCGAGETDPEASISQYVRYKEGYLVEGRVDGKIGTWAV